MTSLPTIVVDDAIPWAAEALGQLGTVIPVPGRAIDRAHVESADALIVRTVTRVDAALVADTRLRFVGTATAGVDHVDVDALVARGIRFASAAGTNAHAVVDYVLTAVHLLALERDPSLLAGPWAVIGYGNVGRRLVRRLRAMGADVRVCDPPCARARARAHAADRARGVAGPIDPREPWERAAADPERADDVPLMPLGDAVAGARIVTVHVPLHRSGPDPTFGLVDAAVLDALARDAVVLNTSRGGVVDEHALQAWLDRTGGRAVLDVWTGEPELDATLALHHRVRLATPHIAGYTLEGKVAATSRIAAALGHHFGHHLAPWDGGDVLGPPQDIVVPTGPTALARMVACLRQCNPIERDDVSLRELARRAGPRGPEFEALRRHYAWRRALGHYRVDDDVGGALVDLGVSSHVGEPLILIAHGSPDPDWRIPLDALAARLHATQPHRSITLAFLDHLTPSLDAAVTELERSGAAAARVVSVFLSPGGGHIKRDIPALCQKVADAHPRVRLTLTPGAIGAEGDVIEAISIAVARVGAPA